MLNIDEITNGFVLDHIQAGRAMAIYHYLNLEKLDCQVATIKNARSKKMGVKDIIKVEGPLDIVDFDILGFIDHNITVDIIESGPARSGKCFIKLSSCVSSAAGLQHVITQALRIDAYPVCKRFYSF